MTLYQMVFETSGALNAEGLDVLKQIFRFVSMRSGVGHTSFCGRVWARLASCVQISCAQHDFKQRLCGT